MSMMDMVETFNAGEAATTPIKSTGCWKSLEETCCDNAPTLGFQEFVSECNCDDEDDDDLPELVWTPS